MAYATEDILFGLVKYEKYGSFQDVVDLAAANHLQLNVHRKQSDGSTIVHILSSDGQADLLRQVLQLCGETNTVNDVDVNGNTALHLAIGNAHLPCVDLLLKQPGIDLTLKNAAEDGPYMIAVRAGNAMLLTHTELGRLYTAENLPRDIHNNSPLHVSARTPNLQLITMHLSDIDWKNKKGQLALHVAATHGGLDACKVLTGTDAERLNCRDEDGVTPVHLMAAFGHVHLLKWCMGLRNAVDRPIVDMDIKDNKGATALSTACCLGRLGIVEALQGHELPKALMQSALETTERARSSARAKEGGSVEVTFFEYVQEKVEANTYMSIKATLEDMIYAKENKVLQGLCDQVYRLSEQVHDLSMFHPALAPPGNSDGSEGSEAEGSFVKIE